jgi:hypothetical protein
LTHPQQYCTDLHDGKTAGAMIDDTQVFSHLEQGDLSDADQLLPLVCDELHTPVYGGIRESAANKNDMKIPRVGSSGECLGPRGMRSPGVRGSAAPGFPGALVYAAADGVRRGEVYDVAIVHSRL